MITKVELKFITVVDGELFATRINGVLPIHELCVRSWAIQMLVLGLTMKVMALEDQTSQFGWRMSTVVELKNHWLIAITTGGGEVVIATTPMMWVCLVWIVSICIIGYSVIVALTGLPIGYSVIVALTGLPIGYSVIVALTGLPIGYSVIVALTGLPIGYSVIGASPTLASRPLKYWCYRPCTKYYDKNRITYACNDNSMV